MPTVTETIVRNKRRVERTGGFEHIGSIIRRVLGLIERTMTHAGVAHDGR